MSIPRHNYNNTNNDEAAITTTTTTTMLNVLFYLNVMKPGGGTYMFLKLRERMIIQLYANQNYYLFLCPELSYNIKYIKYVLHVLMSPIRNKHYSHNVIITICVFLLYVYD